MMVHLGKFATIYKLDFPLRSSVKTLAFDAGSMDSIPGPALRFCTLCGRAKK